MFTATLWVRGPNDVNWRMNAKFHRRSWNEAIDRVILEDLWYKRHGYRTFMGNEAPELPVPLREGEVG